MAKGRLRRLERSRRDADRPARTPAGRRAAHPRGPRQPVARHHAPGGHRVGGVVRRRPRRLPGPRRIPRRAGRAADVPGLPVLRGGVAVDDRLRRHHPVHRIRAAGQHRGLHAAADRVPGGVGRHDARGALRAVAAGVEDSALEEQSAQPHHRHRLRHQGQNGGRRQGQRRGRPGRDRRRRHRPQRPSTTPRPPAWSPCTATPPNPTCCGWPAPSTRRRSSSPPTATTPPCWSP